VRHNFDSAPVRGTALIWLLRSADTVFIAASIPDTTHYWGDDFVLSLDIRGDGGPSPQHDDFQWYLRRVLDSSVVFRGRNGRWEPPRDDPDWRLGRDRSGGGWEVTARDGSRGWSLLLRLDPAWFAGRMARCPELRFESMTTRRVGGLLGRRREEMRPRQQWSARQPPDTHPVRQRALRELLR
jgi:hypothetical protein